MARLRVCRARYRGIDGWAIYGRDGHKRRVSMFFETETAARRTATKMRQDANYVTTVGDFQ